MKFIENNQPYPRKGRIGKKFVKQYANGFDFVKNAINQYHNEVTHCEFPDENHSFSNPLESKDKERVI